MPRYFFHVQTDSRDTDDIGVELDGPQEARAQAIKTCGQLLNDDPKNFWGSKPWSVVVTDAAGLILWDLSTHGFASPAGDALDRKG
ncbi:DUF6894 family protein [Sphingomonas sp. PB4P5]|uniref:DUF6894 family protein n=1 Tax=Parasphingomonas puruogangriensis TaxID=3096155 RepID=UPI002FC725C0